MLTDPDLLCDKEKYGLQFRTTLGDLKQSDDLRVLDCDGHHVFYNFSLTGLGEPVYHETIVRLCGNFPSTQPVRRKRVPPSYPR